MATISHNDHAPSGVEVSYSLANEETFSLTGDETYVTTDPVVAANAEAHPWLEVDRSDEVPAEDGGADVVAVEFPKTAIDAALDQNEAQYVGEGGEVPIAETLAADEEQGDEPIEVESDADFADVDNPDEPTPAEDKE